jgi:hypothetical protein
VLDFLKRIIPLGVLGLFVIIFIKVVCKLIQGVGGEQRSGIVITCGINLSLYSYELGGGDTELQHTLMGAVGVHGRIPTEIALKATQILYWGQRGVLQFAIGF